jgi:hypothetical protein
VPTDRHVLVLSEVPPARPHALVRTWVTDEETEWASTQALLATAKPKKSVFDFVDLVTLTNSGALCSEDVAGADKSDYESM